MSPTAAEVRQMAKAAIPPVVSTILMVSCVFLFLLFYSLFLPERLVKPVMGTSGFIGAALGLIGLRWHRERSLTETLSGRTAIVVSSLVFLLLCGLLVAGYCNRLTVSALPGSEIHVDGKYHRKVLPPKPGDKPGLQTERLTLTWESHTIEIRNHPMAPESVEVFHERFPWGWMRLGQDGSEHDARCTSRLNVAPPLWQFDQGDGLPDSRLVAVNRGLREDSEARATTIFDSRLKRIPWSAKDREKAEAESDALALKWAIPSPGWNAAADRDDRLRIEIRLRGSTLARITVPKEQCGPGKPDAQVLQALWAASRGPAMRVLRERIHDEELLLAVSRSFLEAPPDFATWLAKAGDDVSRTGELQRDIANLVRPPEANAPPVPEARPRPSTGTGNVAPGSPPPANAAAFPQLDSIRNLARETAVQLKAQNLEPAIDGIFESLAWARDRVTDPALKAGLAQIRDDLRPPPDAARRVVVVHYSSEGRRDAADRVDEAVRTLAAPDASPAVAKVEIESVDSGDFVPFHNEIRYFTPASEPEAIRLRDHLVESAALRNATALYVLPGWHQREHAREHACSTDQLVEIWLCPGQNP